MVRWRRQACTHTRAHVCIHTHVQMDGQSENRMCRRPIELVAVARKYKLIATMCCSDILLTFESIMNAMILPGIFKQQHL